MLPKDALGAFTEHVDRRFHDFEAGMKTKLIDAMNHEDKVLNQYIEKNGMGPYRSGSGTEPNQGGTDEAEQHPSHGVASVFVWQRNQYRRP
jgi:nuclear pore complex protein Nup133